jgi:hypothetical protein
MADHSKPTVTSTYANYTSELDGRLDDLALGFDPATTSPTNVPTNAIRWASASNKWQKWNGSSWGDLSGSYSININGTVGATTPAAGSFTNASYTGTLTGGSGVVNIGSGQVYKDASGLVGIGTSSPADKLSVVGTTNREYVRVESTFSSSGSEAGIRLKTAGTNGKEYLIFNANTEGSLRVFDATAASERMRIDSSGNLLVGTTNGYGKFTVQSTAGTGKVILDNYASVPTTENVMSIYADASRGYIQSYNNGYKDIAICSGGGNVGIGTSSPDTLLNIQGLNPTLLIQDSDEAGDGFIKFQTANGTQRGFIQTAMTADVMLFGTGTSERVRIDSSGNVGIGTTSISGKLSINGEVYAAAGAASGVAYGFYPKGTYGNTGMFSPAANTVAFATTGGERMRIDSSGNLLVGCTSLPGGGTTGTAFQLGASISGMCTWTNRSSTTAASDHAYFYNPNGIVGFIRTTSSATSYSTSSDYRLKEAIAPMTGALATVAALKPVTYKWKADGSDGQGFIAHELQEVVPDCVHGEKDAVDAGGNPQYQGIDTSFLVATLTAAIQEQQAIIESLTARVSALEGN